MYELKIKMRGMLRKANAISFLSLFRANLINKIVAFLCNILIVNVMSKTQYGIFSSISSTYSLFLLCNGIGTAAGIFQYGLENIENEKKRQYYQFSLNIALKANLVLAAMIYFYGHFEFSGVEGAGIYIKCLCVLPFLDYIRTYTESFLRSQKDNKRYARVLNVSSISYTLFTLIGAWLGGVSGAILGRYVSGVLSATVGIAYSNRYGLLDTLATHTRVLTRSEKWGFIKYSVGMAVSVAASTALYLIDITMVGTLIGEADTVALYKVASLIPNNLIVIPSSLVVAALPYFVSHNRDVNWFKRNLKRVFCFNFAVCGVVCVGTIVTAPWLVPLIWGNEYLGSVLPLQILSASFFLIGSFRTLGTNLLCACRRVKENLYIGVLSCIANVIFNMLLIPRMGYIGAAWATFGVSVLASGVSMVMLYRAIREMEYESK